MPPEAVNTAADGSARTVRVQVLTPPGVLNRAGQKQLAERRHADRRRGLRRPDTGAPHLGTAHRGCRGRLGIAGTAFGKEEFAALAAKKT